MKQYIKPILFGLTFFASSVLLAASWHEPDTDASAQLTPVSNYVRNPLEQAVLESYNTYVGGAPDAEDLDELNIN